MARSGLVTSVLLDSRFEPRIRNVMFWIIWYPLLF